MHGKRASSFSSSSSFYNTSLVAKTNYTGDAQLCLSFGIIAMHSSFVSRAVGLVSILSRQALTVAKPF